MTLETQEPETTTPPRLAPQQSWPEMLAIALVITLASDAIPDWGVSLGIWRLLPKPHAPEQIRTLYDVLALAFGLLLALPTSRRSGLILGKIDRNLWKVAIVTITPIVLTAIVYSRFTSRPFTAGGESTWIISPAAQDLVFCGYLYGYFATRTTWRPIAWLPLNGASLLTACFFALWHVPNFAVFPPSYVSFQLCYVFVGALWMGTTRIYTGSLIYTTISHMAVNFIAVHPL